MNIISNNCIGAALYRVNDIKFCNPFSWGGLDIDDFIFLVNNYDFIDFNKVSFSLENRFGHKEKSVLCKIDNKIDYHFSHYRYREDSTPTIEKYTVNYKDIIKYSKEKYFSRLNRTKEKPTFIYSFNLLNPNDNLYLEIFNKLLSIDKDLIIVLHKSVDISNTFIKKNIRVIQLEDKYMVIDSFTVANELKNILILY